LLRKLSYVVAKIGREEEKVVEQEHIRFDVEETECQRAVTDRFEREGHGRV
jgi:hypothetical protein